MIETAYKSTYNEMNALNDKEYFSNFAYIMHAALIKNESLYTSLIDNMYEICERDLETVSDALEKASNAYDLVAKTSKVSEDKPSPLGFGYFIGNVLSECVKEPFLSGELLALGCVAEGFISYHKNWLTKEEFYEIRDMFVPFYLPISVDMLDINAVIAKIKDTYKTNENGLYTLPLLKKIGKTVIDNTVSIDDIQKALEEINFDEAW